MELLYSICRLHALEQLDELVSSSAAPLVSPVAPRELASKEASLQARGEA